MPTMPDGRDTNLANELCQPLLEGLRDKVQLSLKIDDTNMFKQLY
jgi:hypothetical protein